MFHVEHFLLGRDGVRPKAVISMDSLPFLRKIGDFVPRGTF
jgi:hypothetical protein